MGRKINVTKEQQDWLREHYADTLNEELMDALGLKFSTFHRLVRTLGLTKSEAYMNEIHVKASDATAKWWRINRDKVAKKGLPAHLVPYMHKPGDKPWAGGNEEKWRDEAGDGPPPGEEPLPGRNQPRRLRPGEPLAQRDPRGARRPKQDKGHPAGHHCPLPEDIQMAGR